MNHYLPDIPITEPLDKPKSHIELIARWNYLGALPRESREELVRHCEANGGHDPSGEQFMTSPPIDTCWRCGANFRKPNDS